MKAVFAALALLGRYGAQAFAVSLFAGLALPSLAAIARPYLGVTIFVFLLTTFVRVDVRAVLKVLRAPSRFAAACASTILVPPVVVSASIALIGRPHVDPGLLLGIAVLAASPPIMSSPAIAMLLGIEPALIIATVIVVTVLSPLISPVIAGWIAGGAVPLDLPALVMRLVSLVGGAALVGLFLRRVLGRDAVLRHKASLDGIGVLMYFVFAVAAMDGVPAAIAGDPWRVARYLAIAFGLSIAGYAAAWGLLRWVSPSERLVLGYATGQRNMGLLIAAFGAGVPDTTFLFFALAQFPIYIGPQIIQLITRRFAVFHPSQPAHPISSRQP